MKGNYNFNGQLIIGGDTVWLDSNTFNFADGATLALDSTGISQTGYYRLKTIPSTNPNALVGSGTTGQVAIFDADTLRSYPTLEVTSDSAKVRGTISSSSFSTNDDLSSLASATITLSGDIQFTSQTSVSGANAVNLNNAPVISTIEWWRLEADFGSGVETIYIPVLPAP